MFLRNADGSFSENFYGLKRARVSPEDPDKTLPFLRRQRRLSLLFLVVIPYLKDKLDQWYNSNYGHNAAALQAGDVENFSRPNQALLSVSQRRLASFVRIIYPTFHAVYEGLFFIYQILYMYEYTSYFTPFLHLMGLSVKRLSMKDIQLQTHREYLRSRAHTNDPPLMRALWKVVDGASVAIDLTKYLLPLAIFFFKFLEWWYADNTKGSVTSEEPLPPPPEPPKVEPLRGLQLPEDRSLCPICNKPRVNPAMLPTGFVFCYTCIHPHVQEHGTCPVTLIPTSTDKIRRIFDEGSD
jgi:hypothetical protein